MSREYSPSSTTENAGSGGVDTNSGGVKQSAVNPMSSSGLGLSFGTGLTYDSQGSGDSGFGDRWMSPSLAGLSFQGSTVFYKTGPNTTLRFTPGSTAGEFEASYFVRDVLTEDTGSGDYSLLSPSGAIRKFDNTGKLISFTSPGGEEATVTYAGSEVDKVSAGTAGNGWEYDYTWNGSGQVSQIIYKVNGVNVLKTEFGYFSGKLQTVTNYEAAISSSSSSSSSSSGSSWGSPISTSLYSYHSGSGLLRHVITPSIYRQMVNNGITDPASASEPQLNAYAQTRYEYGDDGRVSTIYTNGGRYEYHFSYYFSSHTGGGYNVWKRKTVVTRPQDVQEVYYLNAVGEVMLHQVEQLSGGSVTKTWNTLYQRFEDTYARRVLTANDSAIDTVNESLPELVTLSTTQGLVTEYQFNSNGLREYVQVMKGAESSGSSSSSSSPKVKSKLKSWTYVEKTETGLGTIWPVASETVYRNENNTGGVTTNYAYLWHTGTLQPSKITTTLPPIPTSENGTGVSTVTEEHFDSDGYRTKSVDGVGTETTYTYDKVKGGMTQMVQDAGTGNLNLTTTYELDYRGRVTCELGPEHVIDIAGTDTTIRSASWTYYKDQVSEQWNFRGYRKSSDDSDHVVGAVQMRRTNSDATRPTGLTDYRMDETISAEYTGSNLPSETTSFETLFPRSSWESWDLSFTDTSQEMRQTFSYWDIPSTGYGTLDVDYGRRLYDYDASGRQNQTTCAGNTTDKTTFNAMGWAVQEELGIVESSSSSSSSSNPSSLLTVTTLREFDDDGNLTKVTLPVDSTTANDRVTDFSYDFRNRQIQTETEVEKDGGGTWTLIQETEYDNRDLVQSVTSYHTSIAAGNRMSYQEMEQDVLGRTYQTSVYAVENSTGATSNPQVSDTWFDANNRTVKTLPAGSKLFTATEYDAIGRVEVRYQAYGLSSSSSSSSSSGVSNPASVANATVMEQTEPSYDAASNLISTTRRQRYDDATGLGALGSPSSGIKARVTYTASYPDALGRTQATVIYGTNDNASWTRSATIPPRTDDELVTSMTYDPMSRVIQTTDPEGIHTANTYDQAGRLIKVVENSPGSSSSSSSSGSGGVDVRITHYEYTSDSWLRKLKSDNASTGQQVTEWVYGVSPTKGSDLYSNRLVYQKIYPDGESSSSSSSSGSTIDRVTNTFNRQQQLTTMTDQVGTKHDYDYDKLGRLLSDSVVGNFGTNVDQTIGKLETGYDERGRVIHNTSYNTAGTGKVNQVVREYNNFNQLVTEYQEHSSTFDPDTSRKVTYTFADGANNTPIRPTGIKYPHTETATSSTTIAFAYTSQQSDALSRFDEIKEGSDILSSFKYVGLGMMVAQKYNAAANTELTYGNSSNDYNGYDLFGRIAKTLWKEGTNTLVESEYGHNRVGGITWRRDVEAHNQSPAVETQDNYYWYDGLYQVTQHERGNLTGTPYSGIDPTTRQQQEIFTFDETGNWLGYDSQTPSLNQDRTHNKANEITSISPTSGAGAAVQPVYDKAGNMTTMPQPADWESGYDCTWDAWNRLVKIEDGATTVAEYSYDALTRRISQTTSAGLRKYYYNNQWRVIEELDNTGTADREYVYNPADRWNLIRRKYTDSTPLDTTHYVLRDFLDPVAIVNTSGAVQERYGYEAFGVVRYMTGVFGDLTSSAHEWTWLFHGELLDTSTGLYNYGYRYYHPKLGRWPSRDPIREVGGLNLYCFCNNNANSWMDILGKELNPPYPRKDPDTGVHLPVPVPGGNIVPIDRSPRNIHDEPIHGPEGVFVPFGEEPPPNWSQMMQMWKDLMIKLTCGRYRDTTCCCCDGHQKWVPDPYPTAARKLCKEYIEMYSYSKAVISVASCLVKAEAECVRKYFCCETRNECRLIAHFDCYLRDLFVPFWGMPAGGPDVGWNMLLKNTACSPE